MRVDRTTSLFFDASCLIAAAGSTTGGSGFLLSLCSRGLLRAVVSHIVLLEAERNIQEKRGQRVLHTYHILLRKVPFTVVAVPPIPVDAQWQAYVNPKDAHVIGVALGAQTPYLLTLDLNLIEEIGNAGEPIYALTPGTFIKEILVHHADYDSLR